MTPPRKMHSELRPYVKRRRMRGRGTTTVEASPVLAGKQFINFVSRILSSLEPNYGALGAITEAIRRQARELLPKYSKTHPDHFFTQRFRESGNGPKRKRELDTDLAGRCGAGAHEECGKDPSVERRVPCSWIYII